MKDDVYNNVKPTLCDVCGMVHRTYEDGFEYLDCMRAHKKRDHIKSRNIVWSIPGTIYHSFIRLSKKVKKIGKVFIPINIS